MKQIIFTSFIKTFVLSSMLLNAMSSSAQFELKYAWEGVTHSSQGSRWGTKSNTWIAPDGNIIHTGRDAIAKWTPGGANVWETPITFSPGYVHSGLSLAVDDAGNSYVTAVDPNKEPGDNSLMSDISLIKFSPTGAKLWERWYNNPSGLSDVGAAIAVDQAMNVYITGTSEVSAGVFRIVTLKYNPSGTLLWSTTYVGGFSSRANAIAVDYYTGDVYIAGATEIGSNGFDFTTIKYNTNGTQQWVKTYDGTSADSEHDEALALAIDLDGNVVVTGFSTQSYEFDVDVEKDVEVYTTFKYDRTTGNQVWTKRFGKDQSEGAGFMNARALAITVDRTGNVAVTGYVTDPDNGVRSIATLKYNKADGHSAWTRIYTSLEPAATADHAGTTIGTDWSGNVYVGGYYVNGGEKLQWLIIKWKGTDGQFLGSITNGAYGVDEKMADFAVHPSGDVYASGSEGDKMTLLKAAICKLTGAKDLVVDNDPGQCGAKVEYQGVFKDGFCGTIEYNIPTGSVFPVGTTRIIATSPVNGDTIGFNVTVKDVELPKILSYPSPVTVSCAAMVPAANTSLVTATDNCSVVVTHVGDVVTNQVCANKYTIKRTYKAEDPSGNAVTCEQLITVNDDTAPQINGFSLSQTALWPPDHTMRDITLNYTIVDNCVSQPNVTVTVTSNEPTNGTADGDTDIDWEVIDAHHIRLRAERASNGNGRIYTVTVTVNDGCNPAVTQSKQVVVAHNIKDPLSGMPFKIGSTVNFSGVFYDKPGNRHTAKWLADGSTLVSGVVTEPSGSQNGKVTGAYKFNTAGVYKLQMNVTDQTGITSYVNTNNDLDAIVVIYDPSGGNTYGGGWYTSAAGALKANPAATGKASYGFAVNYSNPSKPKGETQFEFKVGSFEFNALTFDYLAIGDSKAQFRGIGKIIGGQSGVGFTMTVIDGALDGSGIDKIRMKIFNRNTGQVYYDNQPGESDAADPVTVVGTNSSIVIQKPPTAGAPVTGTQIMEVGKDATSAQVQKDVKIAGSLQVTVFPNPSNRAFSAQVKSADFAKPLQMQVYDQNGKLMEKRENINAGSIIKFGEQYRPGVYYLRIMQGSEQREFKLVKVSG